MRDLALRRRAALGALVAAALGVPATPGLASHVPGEPLGPSGAPDGAIWTEEYVPSFDGTVLHVDVLRPEAAPPGTRTPVILSMSAYHTHSAPPVIDPRRQGPAHLGLLWAARPWERGYSVAYVDMRGFGASEGCVDLGGELDRRDAVAMIRWAASRDWSSGRVVMAGRSYSGIPVLAALERPPRALAGAILVAPAASRYRATWMNGVHYEVPTYSQPGGYSTGYGSAPGTAYDEPRYHEAWARGLRPDCWDDHHAEQLDPDPTTPYWRERALVPEARGRSVPVLTAQGLRDQSVKPDDFDGWWSHMRGWRSAWIGQFDHDSPLDARAIGLDGFLDVLTRFLDATLSEAPLPESDLGVLVQEAPSGQWRREAAWPPDDRAQATLEVLAGTYRDVPGNRAEGRDPKGIGAFGPPSGAWTPLTGEGTWSFSPALTSELHLAGRPALDVEARGPAGANLIALLYDVAPDGEALLISRGSATVPGHGRVQLVLYPQDWRLSPGHRVGLLLSGADELWWAPHRRSLAQVEVTRGALALPVLETSRDDFVEGASGGTRIGRHGPIEIDPAQFERRTGRFDR